MKKVFFVRCRTQKHLFANKKASDHRFLRKRRGDMINS